MKITAESFIFPNAHNTSIPKKVVHRNKKKPQVAHRTSRSLRIESESTLQSSSTQVVRSEDIANILLDRKIYIEKKLFNHKYLKEIAEAMGAIVKDTFDKTVTDFITDTKYGEKQIKAVANKGKRFVSPIWLTSCYQEKTYLPPIHFPYNFQKDINCLAATNIDKDELDDNPFGLEEVDYDYLEASKPGNQLNLDAFITRIPREQQQQEETIPMTFDQPSQRETSMSQANTVPLDEEGISTLDEIQREFYYNNSNDSNNTSSSSSSSSSSKKRRVENNEARTLRKNEIAARLNSANSSIKRVTTRSNSQKSNTSLLSTSNSVYGQPKFNVWYGEQEFKHVTSNK